jgi:hypothetical protein
MYNGDLCCNICQINITPLNNPQDEINKLKALLEEEKLNQSKKIKEREQFLESKYKKALEELEYELENVSIQLAWAKKTISIISSELSLKSEIILNLKKQILDLKDDITKPDEYLLDTFDKLNTFLGIDDFKEIHSIKKTIIDNRQPLICKYWIPGEIKKCSDLKCLACIYLLNKYHLMVINMKNSLSTIRRLHKIGKYRSSKSTYPSFEIHEINLKLKIEENIIKIMHFLNLNI